MVPKCSANPADSIGSLSFPRNVAGDPGDSLGGSTDSAGEVRGEAEGDVGGLALRSDLLRLEFGRNRFVKLELDCDPDGVEYTLVVETDFSGRGGGFAEDEGEEEGEEEVEGMRSRASLIGLERLRGRWGRLCCAAATAGGLNEPRNRVRKVPGEFVESAGVGSAERKEKVQS